MECSRNFSRRGPTIRLWAVAAVAVLVCGLAVAESPQVFYPFNGNANDLSGRTGRNGTLQGAPTLGADRNSVANQAYSFNGTSQYVTTPYQQGSGITAYSISAWFRSNSADTNGRTIVSARGADADRSLTLSMGTGFGVPAGRIFFGLDTSGVGFGVYTNTAYNDNNWHHVVGIFSRASGTIVNGDFTIYVDGAQAATTTVSVGSPGTAPITNTSTTTIGRQMQWASSYWNGGLDDIGIYARVLSAGDIACLYSATAAMKSTWDFNGAGNVEGWTAMNQIASGPTQSGGQMQYTTAAAASDPMIGSPMMALPRAQGSWLKVRAQNGTTATGAILFWDSDLVADFTGGHQGNYPINPGDTQVSEYWLNLATTGANWTGTTYIQQFRFDFPDNGGSLTGPVNVDQIAILSSGPPAPTVAAVTRQNPVTATWTNASQV
ncbi:MAG: LamG domain-containing protein, partial [Candidatus Hydrogenedentes bacterium]|nr:LamG domain-containing protein [Candidatus Hydrogenedentota bacterium]